MVRLPWDCWHRTVPPPSTCVHTLTDCLYEETYLLAKSMPWYHHIILLYIISHTSPHQPAVLGRWTSKFPTPVLAPAHIPHLCGRRLVPSSCLLVTSYGQSVEEWLHIVVFLNGWKISLQKHLSVIKLDKKMKGPGRGLRFRMRKVSVSLANCGIARPPLWSQGKRWAGRAGHRRALTRNLFYFVIKMFSYKFHLKLLLEWNFNK